MTTIAAVGAWRAMPTTSGASPQRTQGVASAAPVQGAGTWAGMLGLGVVGGAGLLAGLGVIHAGAQASPIGRVLGYGALAAAVAGVGYLAYRGNTNRHDEYLVHFASEPDLSGVPPEQVYGVLRRHHEQNAPAVERELAALQAEGKVYSYDGIIGANGFVVDVRHGDRAEVEQRLASIPVVGDVQPAGL